MGCHSPNKRILNMVIKDIKNKRVDGSVTTVEKTSDTLRLSKRQYDKDTGLEVEPVEQFFQKDLVLKRKAELESELDDINEVLKLMAGK